MPTPSATAIDQLLAVGGETTTELVDLTYELKILAAGLEDLLGRHAPLELAIFQRKVQNYNAAWKNPAEAKALWTTNLKVPVL